MKRLTVLFALLVFVSLQIFSQARVITGKVTYAEDGSALPGVSVVVQGTTLGTITDVEGNYTLSVPETAQVLQFTFVGMETYEIPIEGRSVINVSMEEALTEVAEVIVLGYTTRGKNAITGSTVQVKGENLKDVPVLSVDQALQGKVAGLTISTTSGTPGAVQDIRIRGVGSITAGNDPLFVIDGVPVVNDNFTGSTARSSLSALSALNNNDIESISVLKDASATSAYGARGSNGVIVITTKRGKAGKTKFDFSSSIGFQNNASPGLTPLNGDQRRELLLESIYNTYGAAYGFDEAGAYDFMATNNLDGGKLQNWSGKDGNWVEEVTNKNAPITNVNLSATGGDETASFYASLGYNKTEGTVIGPDFERITASLNYNRNFSEKINFSTNMNVSNTFQNIFLEQAAYFANPHLTKYFMSPWEQPYNPDGTLNTNLTTSIFNTLYTIENDVNTNDYTRAINNSFLEWEIIDNLKFKTLLSLDYNFVNFKEYQNRVHGDAEGENGYAYGSSERNFNMVAQNSLDYDLTLSDHKIAFKALIEFQKNKRNLLWGSGENFPADGLTYIDNAGANLDAGSSFTDWDNLSYLGMANYNYLGKYIADFTFRREGSSRFAPDLRFGTFWSAGAAWNISQENFLAGVSFISNLRLRASYGLSGSSAIGINQYQALLSYDADYADQGAVYPSSYGNTNLTWEKNKNYDVGMDFAVLDNRISGSFAYFSKETYDLLQDVPLTRTSGHSDITQNVGTVVNKGLEFLLDFNIVRSRDLNFNLSVNLATVNNEVTELAKDGNGDDINIQTGTKKVEVGYPIYAWFMRKWAGVDPDNGLPQWFINGEDGEITNDYFSAEEAYQGESAMPTYSGGFTGHVDFKGVFLDANFYFAGGHKIYEDWSRYTHHDGYYGTLYYNGVEELMDRWQKPGDITDVPLMIYGAGNEASRTSTRFLYEGDYLRLKDLVLGYTLPSSIPAKIGLGGATVYARGTNMLTWVKDDKMKYDPEVRANGFTYLTTPPVKSIVFGLNLNF
jgi:TonB-linked SusC/RagA family outer membrane protein